MTLNALKYDTFAEVEKKQASKKRVIFAALIEIYCIILEKTHE